MIGEALYWLFSSLFFVLIFEKYGIDHIHKRKKKTENMKLTTFFKKLRIFTLNGR